MALLALAGCPASLDDPSRFDITAGASNGAAGTPAAGGGGPAVVDTTCLVATFTAGSCLNCHYAGAGDALGAGLDLKSAGVATRLVNVMATHHSANGACPAANLIDTASPDSSWLLVKVNGQQGTCGQPMPLVGTPLTADQIACIRKFATDEAAALGSAAPAAAGAASAGVGGAGGTAATSTAGTGGT